MPGRMVVGRPGVWSVACLFGWTGTCLVGRALVRLSVERARVFIPGRFPQCIRSGSNRAF
eukprot:365413-Chlamydomonas_euryale.AAC.7